MLGSRSAILSGLGPWSSRGLLITGGLGTGAAPVAGKPKATILTEGYGQPTGKTRVLTLGYGSSGSSPTGNKPKATILTQGFGVGTPQLLVTLGFSTSGTSPTPPAPTVLAQGQYDTWGGTWGTSWAHTWYRGASTATAPRPSGGFPEVGDRGPTKRQTHMARVQFGIEEPDLEIINGVAYWQAQSLDLDEAQQQQELAEEFKAQKIELKSEHIKALNDKRRKLIDEEIGNRLREIQDQQDLMILLLIASA